MSETWEISTLGEQANFISGSGFPESLQGGKSGDLPFYKVSDMSTAGNEVYLSKANNYVSRRLAVKRGWKIAPAGSIAFAKVGAALLLNRRRKLKVDSLIDNNMIAVQPKNGIAANWLYWQLLRVNFADFVQDGALPSVNQKQLSAIKVPVPESNQQEKITQILDTLDTTIRQTEAIIAKLQQVKQGLLHDLLTRGINANGQLRPPVEQAPHLYKESPLGWIPREWEIGHIDNYLIKNDGIKPGPFGSSIKKESYVERGFKIYGQEQVIVGDQYYGNYFITTRKFLELQDFAVAEGDILISLVGTIGKILVLQAPLIPGLINPRLMRLRPDQSSAIPDFIGLLVSSDLYKKQILANAGGGTMPVINKRIVSSVIVPVIEVAEQKVVLSMWYGMQSRINKEILNLEKLRKQKSALMDDLLTGRVRVTALLSGESPVSEEPERKSA